MFKHMLVGVDGDEGGRDAIALARDLGEPDTAITLAHVYRGDPQVWRGSSPPYAAEEEERTTALLRAARAEAGLDAELRVRGSVSVGRGLHELAEDGGVDLIVIGSSRRGAFGRVLTGDDARATLNTAPCSVAIAPAGFAETPAAMREIGVAYDGSPESEHAVSVARKLAAEHATKLSAFEAVAFPSYTFSGPAVPDEEGINKLVAAARDRIGSLEGVEAHAVYGNAVEELVLYSASLDLLVIGSRGHGPIGRLVHGSTAHQLARQSRCPLLVLNRAARSADQIGASAGDSATEDAGARARVTSE